MNSHVAQKRLIRRRKKLCVTANPSDPNFFQLIFRKKILIKPNFEKKNQFIAVLLTIHRDNGV